MPEGDTIHRAAHTLHRALAGRAVVSFQSVFAQLTRVDDDRGVVGRTIERVEAHGKHLLMFFSGDLILRTHMRMHGSWHIYRPGERWQRPRHEMRIVLRTDAFEAVAFSVPVAAFDTRASLARHSPIPALGPDVLSTAFDLPTAIERLETRGDMAIADALLDQRALAGIGNVYKSEILFVAGINPFTRVRALERQELTRLVEIAMSLMRANVDADKEHAVATRTSARRTTSFANPNARLWVYGRAAKPCRRCATPISRAKQGPDARSTYWCTRCQTETAETAETTARDAE